MVFERDYDKATPPPAPEVDSVFKDGQAFFKFGVRDMVNTLYTHNIAREEAPNMCHAALSTVQRLGGFDDVYQT
jgi:hypothetical protein